MEAELERLRAENASLRGQLEEARGAGGGAGRVGPPRARGPPGPPGGPVAGGELWGTSGHGMTREQVSRYSRQVILEQIGPDRQARLLASSALVVGAGGLGSPAGLYLAAMGVGRVGVVDRDTVDASNLHRQIMHPEASVGAHKADSARDAIRRLNASCAVEVHREGLHPGNAAALVARYDVVLDCTDNAPSRYLLSDACVAAGRPLVSAAALGTDGQLSVYHHGGGPCYRCVHPRPPRPEHCASCSDAGVLGAVPGAVGALQAVEAVKVLTGAGEPLSGRLLVLDAWGGTVRTVRLRGRDPGCAACGDGAAWGPGAVAAFDYRAFTGQATEEGPAAGVAVLGPGERVLAGDLGGGVARAAAPGPAPGAGEAPAELLGRALREAAAAGRPLLVDVRPAGQWRLGHVRGSVNVPYSSFWSAAQRAAAEAEADPAVRDAEVVLVCRRGNDSQLAARALQERGFAHVRDVAGGMEAFREAVDASFPEY